jgi:DNA-binding response OmpR family regulator
MARILVIDDDEVSSKLTRVRLTGAGFDVTCHHGPFGSLHAVRRGDYDLILLDILMPALDGSRIMQLIRSTPELQKTKILLYSSMDPEELDRLAQSHGAEGYLSKSCSVDALVARISAMIKGSDRPSQR